MGWYDGVAHRGNAYISGANQQMAAAQRAVEAQGDALIRGAQAQGNLYSNLGNIIEGVREKNIQAAKDARENKLYDMKIAEAERAEKERTALAGYKFDPTRALQSQRQAADNALIAKYEELNKKAAEDPTFNPAMTAEQASATQALYEQATPFKEDVESTMVGDLVAQGVDPLKAKQYAQLYSTGYEGIADRQKLLNEQTKAANEAEKNAYNYARDLVKDMNTINKDNVKDSMGDLSAIYDKVNKLGNSGAVLDAISLAAKGGTVNGKAIPAYSTKSIKEALAYVGGGDPKTDLLDLTDLGDKDVDINAFNEYLVKHGKIANTSTDKAFTREELMKLYPNAPKTHGVTDARTAANLEMKTRMDKVLEGLKGTKVNKNMTAMLDTEGGSNLTDKELKDLFGINTSKQPLIKETITALNESPIIESTDERSLGDIRKAAKKGQARNQDPITKEDVKTFMKNVLLSKETMGPIMEKVALNPSKKDVASLNYSLKNPYDKSEGSFRNSWLGQQLGLSDTPLDKTVTTRRQALNGVKASEAGTVYTDNEQGRQKFVQDMTPLAEQTAKELGVPTEAVLAQWIQETGWGAKTLPGTNNLGNLKAGSSWQGPVYNLNALEFKGNTPTRENSEFRKYKSYADSAADYTSFIKDRYKGALNSKDAKAYFEALKNAGYATDPEYVNKLLQVLSSIQKRK